MSQVICNICGQAVKIRKPTSMGAFPKRHSREGHIDGCHGFYVISNNYPEDKEK
jgi:hypothetical protein